MEEQVRNPKQKRAIEKKENIIDAGFDLICKNGYHNTNTAEIAKKANVSTGIVYQYFRDKNDILLAALEKHGDNVFFPILEFAIDEYDIKNFDKDLKKLIENQIKNHKLSKKAHEEITAMIHVDQKVANYFYEKEIEVTEKITNLLLNNGFQKENLKEKVHIVMGIIDNLCHEVTYHKHKSLNYNAMTEITIKLIKDIFK